jgi:hypothetical protein
MAEDFGTFLSHLSEHPAHGVETYVANISEYDHTQMHCMGLTLVKVLNGRPERKTHEVMAGRVEQVASVRRVDIEEDTRDADGLFLKEFLEESLRVTIPSVINS